jgi:gliding motility-associated-like protein
LAGCTTPCTICPSGYTIEVSDHNGCDTVFSHNLVCTDTALQLITVLEDPRIFVPNAFKPNGDGTNDRFYPKTIGIELLELAIYNRWGQAIFRSENPGEGWDGNINGIPAPEGVYAWVLRYRNPKTGEVHKSRGTVTLLR